MFALGIRQWLLKPGMGIPGSAPALDPTPTEKEYLVDQSGNYLTDHNGNRLITSSGYYRLKDQSDNLLVDQSGNYLTAYLKKLNF